MKLNFVKSVLLIVYVLGDISCQGFYFRFRDNVDGSFNIVPVKLFQYEDVKWWEDVRYQTITANDCSLGGLLSRRWTCTTAMCTCVQPSPAVSGLHRALSRRGRQRGRLPRARGWQDRQGGARSQALGGRRGAAQDYKPVMLCTFVLYLYSSTITAKYIRLRSDLIPRTPKVYRLDISSHISSEVSDYCFSPPSSSRVWNNKMSNYQ